MMELKGREERKGRGGLNKITQDSIGRADRYKDICWCIYNNVHIKGICSPVALRCKETINGTTVYDRTGGEETRTKGTRNRQTRKSMGEENEKSRRKEKKRVMKEEQRRKNRREIKEK